MFKIILNYINGLVSLFNGISTFFGYLMVKPFLENYSDTIYSLAREIWVHVFPKDM